MMTWDDYIMTYYDVMNLCYFPFYVVFRKKKVKNMSLFNIHSNFVLRLRSFFFQSILEKHLNYKDNFWALQAF